MQKHVDEIKNVFTCIVLVDLFKTHLFYWSGHYSVFLLLEMLYIISILGCVYIILHHFFSLCLQESERRVYFTDLVFVTVIVTVDNQPVRVQLCDTAGQVCRSINISNTRINYYIFAPLPPCPRV